MAQKWYPVIDYMLCIECGTCTKKCSHGVYDRSKAPAPVVVNPLGCVDHCHGCGNLCPRGAIAYVGEDTGWTPPNGAAQAEESCDCGCGCGCDTVREEETVKVEYLYLDLQTCDRCIGTDKVLEEALAEITPALNAAGYQVEYQKIEISSARLAEKYNFLSSPTVLVNGHDICPGVKETPCGCCSDISGTAVDCRVFEYKGETYEVPPKQMLAEAVLRGIFAPAVDEGCGCYRLPENLRVFFEGKAGESCCGSCWDGRC